MRIVNIIFAFILLVTSTAIFSQSSAVSGINNFAFDLYKQSSTQQKNLIISPFSLSSLLAIVTTGAAGNTQAQLLNALHLSNNQNDILNFLNTEQSSDQFIIANALWSQLNLHYNPTFLTNLKSLNTIDFYQLDFINDSVGATKTINDWVTKKTNGLIEQLIQPGMIDKQTRLVLTNAIYFKGEWAKQFDSSNTKPMPFTLPDNSKATVAMMQQQDNYLYAENNMLQMLQMPYNKNNLAMVILLPKQGNSLAQIKQSLTDDAFNQLLTDARFNKVDVFLPKFKINTELDNLSQTLQQLGITDAFNPQLANFSNLAQEKLFISAVIQKATIAVDEKGTVAAAATGVVMTTAVAEMPKKPILFQANHPFMYLIYDTQSKVILFIGQIANPAQ